MRFTDKAQAALGQADTRSVAIEMTPERREKYKRLTSDVVDILKAGTDGPIEAYMILQFVVQSFEELYGIRGGIIVNHDDFKGD